MQANVVARVPIRHARSARIWRGLVSAPALLLALAAQADVDLDPAATLEGRARQQTEAPPGAVQQTTVSMEHSYTLPAGAQTSDNQGRAYSELSGVTVRRWAGQGRASIGVGVGAVGYRRSGASSQTLAHPAPALTVGVRYRMADQATMYADAYGARGLAAAVAEESSAAAYNARVGLEFKDTSVARNLGLERGSIGMQLESGYRISMKPRRGGVGVYLRGSF